MVDQLVNIGIKGILNYVPVVLKAVLDIVMRNINPVLYLQSITFYLFAQSTMIRKGRPGSNLSVGLVTR